MSRQKSNNWLLATAVVVLAVLPLIFVKGGDFTGSDNKAQEVIKQVDPTYKPWFNSLFKLPSSEVESLLFAVQAGAGAGVIGYVIGLYKGRSEQREQDENSD
jgi:cobalt/nickel transport protein